MELVVFDLDGTLLDSSSQISSFTRETLVKLAQRDIAYTVATGRTLHAARDLLHGQGFGLPQIFKNGVVIWDPDALDYSYRACLTMSEIEHVLQAVFAQGVTPFVFTLEPGNHHAIYHSVLQTAAERRLKADFMERNGVSVLPLSDMPADADITNISALGEPDAILAVQRLVQDEPNLVAYTGVAMEGRALRWIDIHHSNGSKGSAVDALRRQLGLEKVICFGDGDNDLSMFSLADESYAPDNADAAVKAAATAVIGHHDEDGIARFLRERFAL
tara:strand:- start:108197 stop:109018 length:822 start_codon:yes stop_codon:yes gene_type:complete